MNKKAIQLSVNFLVIVIISLAVFSMGIIFLNKIFFSAGEKVAEMDIQTREELARLLDAGDKVAMPFFQKTVIHGKTASFGIGVLNTISDVAQKDFEIVVEFDVAYDKNDDEICDSGDTSGCVSDPDGPPGMGWLAYDDSAHTLKANAQGTYTIAISAPKDAEAGTYIFNAAVCLTGTAPTPDPYSSATGVCGSGRYGYYHLQKIWLSVK